MSRFFNARWFSLSLPKSAVEYLRQVESDLSATELAKIPNNGSAGEFLKKSTSGDYDTEWAVVVHNDDLSGLQGGASGEYYHLSASELAGLHSRSHAVTSVDDHTAGAWKVFYSNDDGHVVELALPAEGFLRSNGVDQAPSFAAVAAPNHNDTGSIQGGIVGEHFHLTAAQHGLVTAVSYRVLSSSVTVSDDTSVQNWFDSPASCALDANSTYEFDGLLHITAGTTSHGINLQFAALSGATIQWASIGSKAAQNNQATALRFGQSNTFATNRLSATASTGAGTVIRVFGVVRTTTAGNLTPRFAFSAAPGGTPQVLSGTRFIVRKLGSDTFTASGGWA
jgi:hypothetical protein